MSRSKQFFKGSFRFMGHMARYSLIGAFVLIAVVFATWKIYQVFSPSTDGSNGSTKIILKSSDHYRSNNTIVPLPNSLTDGTAPNYETTQAPTPLTRQGNNIRLFRIQGELNYR